jgi:recombinational DNA repair protein RecR
VANPTQLLVKRVVKRVVKRERESLCVVANPTNISRYERPDAYLEDFHTTSSSSVD